MITERNHGNGVMALTRGVLFLFCCVFTVLCSQSCRINCKVKKQTIWKDCRGNDANCIYSHPRLNVRTIQFITLRGKVDLRNSQQIKDILVTYPTDRNWDGCNHVVIAENGLVNVNRKTCVSFKYPYIHCF